MQTEYKTYFNNPDVDLLVHHLFLISSKKERQNILKYIIDALCGGEAAVTLYNKHFSVSSTSLALWNLKCSHDLTLIKLLLQW